MSSVLFRIGRSAATRPWRVIVAWITLAVLVVVGSAAFGADLEDSLNVPGLDSQEAFDLLSAAHSDQAGLTAQVVASPRDGSASFLTDATAVDALADLVGRAGRIPNVVGTTDPAAAISDDPATAVQAGEVSADGRVAIIRLQYPVQEDLSLQDLNNIKAFGAAADGGPLQVELGGDLFFALEEPETGTGEMIGLVAAVLILLVAFGSVIAMGLPIGTALVGLAIGTSAMGLVNLVIDIPTFAPQAATMVGLGVGIDYALFLVTRHREGLASGLAVADAAGRAVATAGQAVIFAGGTVVIAVLGMSVTGIPFLTAMGLAISLTVLVMVATSITLLPALLGLAGTRIVPRHRGASDPDGVSQRWARWGTHVSRHAWPYAIGVTVALLALTAPVLSLELGWPGEGTLPQTRTERRAFDLVADGFGPGANGPLVIAVDVKGDPAILGALGAAIAADAGIAGVGPALVSPDGSIATIVAAPTGAPLDASTYATVQRLRADVMPTVLAGSPATAHVGGQSATWADLAGRVAERLPVFIIAVVILSFLLLTVVFRSILVPVKAALLNLLSIGAGYGVLVMVFQWGWGKDLIGLESTVPIVSFIPLMMFAVLFGLSMDYEVFLLTRVREAYLATGDNDRSVIAGLAKTARVITSAALIMISVFLGFVLGEDPAIKMMGLGLATAILVDATVVRLVLVPATMTLLGDRNWWLPAWLDRWLPHVDIDREIDLASVSPAPALQLTR